MCMKCIPLPSYPKMGYAVVYLLFLFLIQNINCEYSLEPPQSVLSKNKKNIKIFPMNFSIFAPEKNSQYIAWACFRNVSG